MKRFISVVLSLLLVLSCTCVLGASQKTEASNLVVNGNAENGVTGWSLLDEWTRFAPVADAYTGNYAFTVPQNWKYVWQEIELQADTIYKLSCYTKGTTNASFYLADKDTQNVLAFALLNEKNPDWKRVDIIYESTANQKVYVKINSQQSGDSDRLIDDITLVEVPQNTGLVKNGGAELGKTNWSGNITVNSQSENVYEGDYSFEVPKGAYQNFNQEIAVEPNTQYIINWVEKGKASQKSFLAINGLWQASVNQTENEAWAFRNLVYTTGADESSVTIAFKRSAEEETDVYIDNICFYKAPEDSFKNGGAEYLGAFWLGDVAINDNRENVYEGRYSFKAPQTKYFSFTQTVGVEPNTKYNISWYEKGDAATVGIHINDIWQAGVCQTQTIEWQKRRIVYKTGENETSIDISFKRNAEEDSEVYIDNIVCELSGAFLLDFQGKTKPDYKGPFICSQENNYITDSGFETGNGNWNTQNFIDSQVFVSNNSEVAQSGEKCLVFKSGAERISREFTVAVKAYTDYYFTVYVKMPTWSFENTGGMTFGIAETQSGDFLVFEDQSDAINRLITTENQLNPASPDGEWHILGVSFETNASTQISIKFAGETSEIYFDNMYLFEHTDAVPYTVDIEQKLPAHIVNENPSVTNCAQSLNLVENGNFSNEQNNFWQSAYGFLNNNCITDSLQPEQGNALCYENNDNYPDRTYYIKWIDVEPQTTYTFAAKYCALDSTGEANFGLLSGDRTNLVMPTTLVSYPFSAADFVWQDVGIVFETQDCDRVGIFIFNGGGKGFIDDIRLFKTYLEAPDEGLLKESGFEKGLKSWQMLGEPYTYTIDSDTVYSGLYSTKVSSSKYGFIAQDIEVVTNSDYTLSLWSIGDGKSIEIAAYGGDDFSIPVFRVWNTTEHSEWTRLSYRFNSGEHTKLKIKLKICDEDANRNIDDIIFRMVCDIDDSGEVNIIDLIRFKKTMANGFIDADILDLDSNGSVESADIVILRKRLLGVK